MPDPKHASSALPVHLSGIWSLNSEMALSVSSMPLEAVPDSLYLLQGPHPLTHTELGQDLRLAGEGWS